MTNKTVVAMLGVMMAAGLAGAERTSDQLRGDLADAFRLAWHFDGKTQEWSVGDGNLDHDNKTAKCTNILAAIDAAKLPGSTKVTLSQATPLQKAGEYTIDELRPTCQMTQQYALVKQWEKWSYDAVLDFGKIGSGQYYDARKFELCVEVYEDLLKAGIPATMKVPTRQVYTPNGEITWAGTIEELRKKWCDPGLARVKAEIEARMAPYKKALKSDKLAMVVIPGANSVRAYILPGGAVSSDPKKLARARVWFSDTQSVNSNRKVCPTGSEIHTVHRYQFNATHKLVKTTDKQYCGTVPKRAYK